MAALIGEQFYRQIWVFIGEAFVDSVAAKGEVEERAAQEATFGIGHYTIVPAMKSDHRYAVGSAVDVGCIHYSAPVVVDARNFNIVGKAVASSIYAPQCCD